MTALDKRFRPLALRLLNKYGKILSYVQTTEGEYDPETSSTSTTIAIIGVKGLLLRVSYGDITSGIAAATDSKIMIAGLSIENPINGDVVKGKYFVKHVSPFYSGEEIAYYELICESR